MDDSRISDFHSITLGLHLSCPPSIINTVMKLFAFVNGEYYMWIEELIRFQIILWRSYKIFLMDPSCQHEIEHFPLPFSLWVCVHDVSEMVHLAKLLLLDSSSYSIHPQISNMSEWETNWHWIMIVFIIFFPLWSLMHAQLPWIIMASKMEEQSSENV